MGWCDDPRNINYNKEIKLNKKLKQKIYIEKIIFIILLL